MVFTTKGVRGGVWAKCLCLGEGGESDVPYPEARGRGRSEGLRSVGLNAGEGSKRGRQGLGALAQVLAIARVQFGALGELETDPLTGVRRPHWGVLFT